MDNDDIQPPHENTQEAYAAFLDRVKYLHKESMQEAYKSFSRNMTFEQYANMTNKLVNVSLAARREGYEQGYQDAKQESPAVLTFLFGMLCGLLFCAGSYAIL